MDEWWTYSLEDFLLFSPRVYVRQFELQNGALWPLHVATVSIGLWLARTVLRPGPNTLRLAFLALAAAWLFVGLTFFPRYDTINWAAGYAIPLVLGEAALLAGLAAFARPTASADATTRYAALILVSYAVLIHPLTAWVAGKPWQAGEVFVIAPDPSAFATLGIVLVTRGWWTILVAVPPLLWCLFSGVTLRAMNDPSAWIPWGVALFTLAALALRGRTAAHPGRQ